MINHAIFARLSTSLLLFSLSSPAISGEALRFQVYLNEEPIGEHSFHISENGELEDVSVRRTGEDTIEAGNRQVPATRYALTTDKLTIDLWYDDALGWVDLSSDTGKGRRLIYRMI